MGAIVLLSGEAGVGKTRLHGEAALTARETDVVALAGRGDGDASEVPLAPVVDSLRTARQNSADRVWPHLVARSRWLSAILPELSATQIAPDPLTGDRHVLFECLLYAVSEAAGKSAALWVLDDMHWADPSSWSFVRHARPRIGRLPIVLVIAYRPDQVLTETGIATLAELGRARDVVELRLRRLQRSQTQELVRSVAPAELDADMLTSIVDRSAGNPAMAADLAGAGVANATTLPPSARAYASARLARLSPAARDLLELVASVGGRAHLELLSSVGSVAGDEAEAELLHAGLARVEGGGWLRCDYPLLAEAVYEQVPWPRRRAIQQKIADMVGRGFRPAARVPFLTEVQRVPKPGACFVFRTPNRRHYVTAIAASTPGWFHRLVANCVRGYLHGRHDPWPTYYRMNTPRAIKRHLSAAGFMVDEIRMLEPYPAYLAFSALAFRIGVLYERVLNRHQRLACFRQVIEVKAIRRPA